LIGWPEDQAVLVLGEEAPRRELEDEAAVERLKSKSKASSVSPTSRKPACLMRRSRSRSWRRSSSSPTRAERKSIGASLSVYAWSSRGSRPAGAAKLAESALQFNEIHRGISSWIFLGDHIAVIGELPDQRIDLAQRERRRRMALDVAPHVAVVSDRELERGGTGRVDDGRTVLLDQAENPRIRRTPASPSRRWMAAHRGPNHPSRATA
jgi:hypothetical protein